MTGTNPIIDALLANMATNVFQNMGPSNPIGTSNVGGGQVAGHPASDMRPQPGEPPVSPVGGQGVAINQLGQMSNSPILTGGGMWASLPNFGIGYD